jgi:hypothetical protein
MCQSECDRCSHCDPTLDLACGHMPEIVGSVGTLCISLGTVLSEIVFVSCVCCDGFILSFVYCLNKANCFSLNFNSFWGYRKCMVSRPVFRMVVSLGDCLRHALEDNRSSNSRTNRGFCIPPKIGFHNDNWQDEKHAQTVFNFSTSSQQ